MISRRVVFPVILSAMLAGCATSGLHAPPPAYAILPQPNAPVPQVPWRWQDLGDAQYDAMLAQTLASNPSVEGALLRIEQARLATADARADGLPQVSGRIGADSSGPATGSTKENPWRRGQSGGLDVSYELDLWGRRGAAQAGADRELSATRHDAAASTIAVASEFSDLWFGLAENAAIADLHRQQAANARETLAITTSRVRAGAMARSELARAQADEQRMALRRTQLQTERARLQNALAVLRGDIPTQAAQPQMRAAMLDIRFTDHAIALPALAARPDVAAAEDRIWSANYRIHQARTQLLPNISLSAGISGSADTIAKLLSPTTWIASLGASLAQTIFDGGVKVRRVTSSEIDTKRSIIDYRQTVLKAVEETDNARRQWHSVGEQIANSDARIAAQEQVLRATRTRYRVGASGLADLLRDQNALYQEQEERIRLKRQRAQAAVALLKAVGRSPLAGDHLR